MIQFRGWAHHFGVCPCGKRGFADKATAKIARKRIDPALRAYRCPDSGWWHLGHLDDRIIQGIVDRREVYGGR